MNDVNTLVEENIHIVRPIIYARWGSSLKYHDLEDLVQEGMIGLISAARNYTPIKNVKFSTYAKFRILGAALDKIRINFGKKTNQKLKFVLDTDIVESYHTDQQNSNNLEDKCNEIISSIKEKIVKSFPKDIGELLYYRHVEELSDPKIAALRGVTGSAINQRLSSYKDDKSIQKITNAILTSIDDAL